MNTNHHHYFIYFDDGVLTVFFFFFFFFFLPMNDNDNERVVNGRVIHEEKDGRKERWKAVFR